MTIHRWESVAHYIETFKSEGHTPWDEGHDRDWDLGVDGYRAMDLALKGDTSLASRACDMLEKIEASIGDDLRATWISSVAGSRVNVAAYLAGSPMSMRRRVKRETTTRHVSVYVDMTCSAGISADTMLRRGMTIIGFLESLQRSSIGVDLYLVCGLGTSNADGETFQVIRVESRPLDLSTAAFAIAHPAFSRNVCYGRAKPEGFYGSWPRSFYRMPKDAYRKHVQTLVGCGEGDVYIPEVYLTDTIVQQPEKWIAERLQQIAA